MRALSMFTGGLVARAAPLAMSRAILSFCRRVKGGLPGLGLQDANKYQTHTLASLRTIRYLPHRMALL